MVLRHAWEISGNVAATCRCYGISRPMLHKRCNQFDELDAEGLCDRSSEAHHSPTATKAEVVERIVHLRPYQRFGPARVAMGLRRCHDVEVSTAWVRRVLHRPAAAQPALPVPRPAPEAVRGKAPGPSGADRCEVHRLDRRGHDQAATASSPPSTNAPRSACYASTPKPTSAPQSSSPVRNRAESVPHRAGPDRQRRPVPGTASVGTCWTAVSAASTSNPQTPGSTTGFKPESTDSVGVCGLPRPRKRPPDLRRL